MNRAPALPLTPEHRASGTLASARGVAEPHRVARTLTACRASTSLNGSASQEACGAAVRRRGARVLTHDAPGRGRKRQITAAREQQVVDGHTEPPRATHWSFRTMAAAQGLSPASIHRIWHAHGLQPHPSGRSNCRPTRGSSRPSSACFDKALVFCVRKEPNPSVAGSQPGLPFAQTSRHARCLPR